MKEITTIGLDTAKSVFQLHGVDADGEIVVRRQLKRRQVLPFFAKLQPCLIGIEACSASHHWSRQLTEFGHTVRLIPPRYVKPYVKSQKNDATDAEAICEAVTRPNMRFAATKSREQQAMLMLHRTRHLLLRQRTATTNAIRAHLTEFGIVAGVGRNGVEALLKIIADESDDRIPDLARECLIALGKQLTMIKSQVRILDAKIMAAHRSSELSRRLAAIPGVGPRVATALVASVADPNAFRSGRQMAAWIGLVPKQNSSGGRDRLGGVTKAGDRYLRSMVMVGALSVIKRVKQLGYTHRPWLAELMARRPVKVAAIALANKIIRMVWAMMVRGEKYREPIALAA
ncbi:MAG: IS110 family transposase [Hyphomicrobiaceae bacterium]